MKRHCFTCGGKLKFIGMYRHTDVFRFRLYRCTQCHSIEWVMCKRKK